MGQPVPTRLKHLRSRIWLVHLPVLACYAVFSMLLTYPWIRYFTTHFPGVSSGDSYFYMWNFWYFREQALRLQNPFLTDAVFFPVGASLLFTAFTLVNDFLALILSLFTSNMVVISNLVFLISLVLAGYFTFLLVDYLTHNKRAAFLAGTIFAFCPYELARFLGHFELTSTHWIPLFILFFLKMTDRRGAYRHAVAAGVIAVLVMLDSYYYAVFLMFFVALFYIYKLLNRAERWEYLEWNSIKKVLMLGIISLLLTAPILAMAYGHAKAGLYDAARGWMGGDEFVSDVTAFFVPSFLHPFWQSHVWRYYSDVLSAKGSIIEGLVFIGWTVTILILFASLFLARQRPELGVWRFQLSAFVILSLGPTLHIMGKHVLDVDGLSVSIPLPFLLVHYIPLFGHVRCPSRLIIMVMVCAAVLSAYTWVWIQEKMRQRPLGWMAAFVLLILMVLFENLSIPYPLCSGKIPAVFQKIAMDKDSGTMLELPLGIFDGVRGRGSHEHASFLMYAQTLHHKKRIGGYTGGRGVKKALSYYNRFPVLRHLLQLLEDQGKGEKVITPEELENDRRTVPDLIKPLSLKYIVVHPEFIETASHQYILQVFNLVNPTYEAEGYLVYKVSEEAMETTTPKPQTQSRVISPAPSP